MRRSFKYRLSPSKTQEVALTSQVETLRRIYNAALAERKEAWENEKRRVTSQQQYEAFSARRNAQRDAEKKGDPGPHFLAQVAAVAMRDTIGRVDLAYQNFFRRCKTGEKPGYPRFRGRDRYDSIPFGNYASGCTLLGSDDEAVLGDMAEDADLHGHRLRLFGVGEVKVRLHRPIRGKIKTVVVKREAGKWHVIFSCDLGEIHVEPSTNPPVGIDVGLEHFLSTSAGEHEPNPRYLKGELPELRRMQRTASRRFRRGKKRSDQSKRYGDAQKRVAKLHTRVKNLRKEHHHKTALKLVRRYGTICVESLNIRGMLGNHKLARAIADAAWGGFVNTLKCKAESAGVRVVEVDPRGTSQECSGCGKEVRKDLKVRQHRCPHCGLSLQRDVNAALNILQRGLSQPAGARPAGHNGASRRRVPRSPPCLLQPLREGTPPEIAVKPRKGNRSRSNAQPQGP